MLNFAPFRKQSMFTILHHHSDLQHI